MADANRAASVQPRHGQKRGGGSLGARAALIAGVLAAFAALGAIGLWPRWQGVHPARADSPTVALPVVVYTPAQRGKGDQRLALPAAIKAFQEATLYARASGYVRRWAVDIGDTVSKGQMLAELEVPELDREIQQARASRAQVLAHLKLAQVTASRYSALVREEAVSAQEADEKIGMLEGRQADLAATEANLKRIEQLRAFQRVAAPFSGTITARNVEVGSLVQAGGGSSAGWLFKLAQIDTLRVHVSVPQSHIGQIREGKDAELHVPELGAKGISAKVMRTAGALDPSTRTLIVELHAENPGHTILSGMYGQVRLDLKEARPNLRIPITALIVGADAISVATVDPDSVIRMKKVTVSRDHGKEVEIAEGLQENEHVVTNPRDSLEDGLRVKAILLEKPAGKKDVRPGEKPSPAAKQ